MEMQAAGLLVPRVQLEMVAPPGLAEAMCATFTPKAYLQRGIAGMRRRTQLLNRPVSRKGAFEYLEAILPVLPHALRHLAGNTSFPESNKGRTHEGSNEETVEVCP